MGDGDEAPVDRVSKLKGQCHEIFDLRYFVMHQFPPSPRVSLEVNLKFAAKDAPPVSLTLAAKRNNLQSETPERK